MVEMQVAEEDIDLARQLVAPGFPEGTEARPGIDDEQTVAASDLDARGMAAEFAEAGPGHGGRAAGSPEADLEQV